MFFWMIEISVLALLSSTIWKKTLLTLSFNTSKDPYTIHPLSFVVFPLSELRLVNLNLLSVSSYLLTVPLNDLITDLPGEIIPVHQRMFTANTKLPGHKICWAFINPIVSQLNFLLHQRLDLLNQLPSLMDSFLLHFPLEHLQHTLSLLKLESERIQSFPFELTKHNPPKSPRSSFSLSQKNNLSFELQISATSL